MCLSIKEYTVLQDSLSIVFFRSQSEHFPHKRERNKDGVVVRALASHHCGSGSIPSLVLISGLSLLLVLVLALGGFSPGTLPKTNISKFQFDPEPEDHRFVSRENKQS